MDGALLTFGAETGEAPGLDLLARGRRLGRHARRGRRSHRAPVAGPAPRRTAARGVRRRLALRRCGRRAHRVGHRARRPRDDGRTRDPRRRGVRELRVPARCAGVAAVRGRRPRRGRRAASSSGARDVLGRAGATSVRVARDAEERRGCGRGASRRSRPSAGSRPDYYCMDGTIPRRHLAGVLARIDDLSREHGLAVANVFHAGDGNLHPLILFDAGRGGRTRARRALRRRHSRACVAVGGTVTGEHGVGVEKLGPMCSQFGSAELEAFHALKRAFDPGGAAQPRQGRADAQPLRRLWRDARARRQAAASDTCRASDRTMHRSTTTTDGGARRARPPMRPRRAPRCASSAATPRRFYGRAVEAEPLERRAHRHGQLRSRRTRRDRPRRHATLARSRRCCSTHGQRLPFEPPAFGDAATVGGAVAAGLSGPARVARGPVRDYVLGARLLTGEGRVLRFGGEVMKNVRVRRLAPAGRIARHPRRDPGRLAQGPPRRRRARTLRDCDARGAIERLPAAMTRRADHRQHWHAERPARATRRLDAALERGGGRRRWRHVERTTRGMFWIERARTATRPSASPRTLWRLHVPAVAAVGRARALRLLHRMARRAAVGRRVSTRRCSRACARGRRTCDAVSARARRANEVFAPLPPAMLDLHRD